MMVSSPRLVGRTGTSLLLVSGRDGDERDIITPVLRQLLSGGPPIILGLLLPPLAPFFFLPAHAAMASLVGAACAAVMAACPAVEASRASHKRCRQG